MVYTWHIAHQALSEVLYIEHETNKLVSRLDKSQITQYHDIVFAIEETLELRQLIIEEASESAEAIKLLSELKNLLVELKRDVLITEKNSKKIIELSRQDVDALTPILKGFELHFSKFKRIEKNMHIENKLAAHNIEKSITKGKDIEDLLLVYIKKIYDSLTKISCEHKLWLDNKFKTLVKALATIHKYEIWHMEFVQSLVGLSGKEIKDFKNMY